MKFEFLLCQKLFCKDFQPKSFENPISSKMFGRKCVQLINDLNQHSKSDVLPAYQKDLVNEVLQEMNDIFEMNKQDL